MLESLSTSGDVGQLSTGIASIRFQESGSAGLERETEGSLWFLDRLVFEHGIQRLRPQSLGCDAQAYTLVQVSTSRGRTGACRP